MELQIGECDVCEKQGLIIPNPHVQQLKSGTVRLTLHYGNMLFCDDCWQKEEIATANMRETDKTVTTVSKIALEASRQIDNSIQVRTDLFNAATVPILDLKKSIDDNPEITNKPYALAEELMNRFEHFKSVIFEANETIVQVTNQQKAIQVYLNQLANQLHADEREKLKIQDINYKPASIKPVKPTRITTTGTRKSVKLDKVELRKYAAELGVAEFTLQMVVVQKGITIEAAANLLRRTINEAKSES